jgi:cysteine desulfurase
MEEKKFYYLDHSATTPMHPEVIEAMTPYFSEKFGNASSIHSLGQISHKALSQARETVANFIGAKVDEIVFTGSGTESDNMAILGTARKLKKFGNHIITSNIEHPAVRNTIRTLKLEGYDITEVPVDDQGLLHAEDVENAIRDETILISVMYANNEIGTIQPIEELAEISERYQIILHTDAVQAFGKLPIYASAIKFHLLSASAHKIYGPKGVGLLYIRDAGQHPKFGKFLNPIIWGGGHEMGWRPATENIPGIVGFAKAVEIAERDLDTEQARQRALRDDFIQWVLENIPESAVNGSMEKRMDNNINLRFKYIEGESLLLRLDDAGIEVSTGSACSSHSSEPSHVLTALNLPPEEYAGSIRITLGRSSTFEELEFVKQILKEAVEDLRKMSPLAPECDK